MTPDSPQTDIAAPVRSSDWLGAVELEPRSCSELRLGRGVGGLKFFNLSACNRVA